MAFAVIGARETPQQLSARLGRPVCMLLRANGLYSQQWLLPGRRIFVPERDFCARDAGPCPLRMMKIPAEEWIRPARLAENLPARLRMWSHTHADWALKEWCGEGRAIVLRHGETERTLAGRTGCTAAELRRINRCYGRLVPGMRWWAPIQNGRGGV